MSIPRHNPINAVTMGANCEDSRTEAGKVPCFAVENHFLNQNLHLNSMG
jgi:hypothetical protein